jgi:CO/xanthine dehydrogenase Mo-binding subunit
MAREALEAAAPASPRLIDGGRRVAGALRFTADLSADRPLEVALYLSPAAHGTIARFDATAALAVPGVVAVLRAGDLPGGLRTPNSRRSRMLAADRVRFVGEPVAAVVAESAGAALDGRAGLEVTIDPEPCVTELRATVEGRGAPVWAPDGLTVEGLDTTDDPEAEAELSGLRRTNTLHTSELSAGDLRVGFSRSDAVVSGTFRWARVHQGYLEPHAVIAAWDGAGCLTVRTPTRAPHLVQSTVARLLDVPEAQVRIVPSPIGGAFGSKTVLLEPLAAAISMRLGRPVRIVLDRRDDVLTSAASPSGEIEIRAGATAGGRLLALDARIVVDDGAFPTALGRQMGRLLHGWYRVPHCRVVASDVVTHTAATGPYRAPGAPAVAFAIESLVDELARRLRLDPLELRLGHLGSLPPDGVHERLAVCLERLRDHPLRRDGAGQGVGLAAGMLGTSAVRVEAVCDLSVRGILDVRVGSVDFTGVRSALADLVARDLGIHPSRIRFGTADTLRGPSADITGSSQTLGSSSRAVRAAIADLRRRLTGGCQLPDLARPADTAETADPGPVLASGRGSAGVAGHRPGCAAHLAAVRVDRKTGQVAVTGYVAVQEVGVALRPALVEGQVHGGVAQGLGLALDEGIWFDNRGNRLGGPADDLAIPGPDRVPVIETVLVSETDDVDDLTAIRGVGEPPIVPVAAAVGNAIRAAAGARPTDLPITSESVWRLLSGTHDKR